MKVVAFEELWNFVVHISILIKFQHFIYYSLRPTI
jgi:hypothetical protein